MTTNPYSNGNGHLNEADIHNGFIHQLEEPVQIKGFAVTYFVLQRQVVQMGTYFSLKPTVMTPRLITTANLPLRS